MSEIVKVNMAFERETKNTYRFAEEAEYDPPAISTLYIHKSVFRGEGSPPRPERVTVTVESA